MSVPEPSAPRGDEIEVEVVLAWPDRVWRRSVRLPAGATVRVAVEASGVDAELGGAGWAGHACGVFGRARDADSVLADGDRVELYRPLTADPKDARRRRARWTRS